MTKPASPLLARIKAAIGLPDATMAQMIGVSRQTVQFYVSGRVPENLSLAARLEIRALLEDRVSELKQILRDL